MSDRRHSGLKLAAFAGLCLVVAACTTSSRRDDGWLTSDQANAESKQLQADGMMPVAIDCWSDKSTSPPEYLLRIKWAPNRRNIVWRWDVGDAAYMKQRKISAASQRLKTIQFKSDINSYCAIWRSA
jgi:uncharacterized protein (DUF2235 family)